MDPPEATTHNLQTDKKIGTIDNQKSGTGISQKRPLFSLFIVVEDIFFQDYNYLVAQPSILCAHLLNNLNWKKE